MSQLVQEKPSGQSPVFAVGRFFQLGVAFLGLLPAMRDREVRVLLALACLCEGYQTTIHSQLAIGEAAGLDLRATQRALKALEARGLITCCKRRIRGGNMAPSQYTLNRLINLTKDVPDKHPYRQSYQE